MSEAKIDKIPCIFPASREFRFSETGSLETASSSAESHKLDHRDPASGAMRGETFRLSRSTPGAGHDEGTGFERDCLMTSPMATFLGRCVAESYLDGSRGRSRAVPV